MLRKVLQVGIQVGRVCYLDCFHTRVASSRTCPSKCVRLGWTTGRITQLSMLFQVTKSYKYHYETSFWPFLEIHFQPHFNNRPTRYPKSPNHKNTPEINRNTIELYAVHFLQNLSRTHEIRADHNPGGTRRVPPGSAALWQRPLTTAGVSCQGYWS